MDIWNIRFSCFVSYLFDLLILLLHYTMFLLILCAIMTLGYIPRSRVPGLNDTHLLNFFWVVLQSSGIYLSFHHQCESPFSTLLPTLFILCKLIGITLYDFIVLVLISPIIVFFYLNWENCHLLKYPILTYNDWFSIMYLLICFMYFLKNQWILYIWSMNLFLRLPNQMLCKKDKRVQINHACFFSFLLFKTNI